MARKRSALTGKRATVWVERNGCGVRLEDIPAAESAAVLADLLEAMRALNRYFDELTPDLTPVPGGAPVDGNADDFGAHRVGFRTTRPHSESV